MTGSGFARIWAPSPMLVSLILLVPATFAQQFSVVPSALGFGNVAVGKSLSQAVSLTNHGTRTLTLSKPGVSGTGFSIHGLTFPLSLGAGKSAVLDVNFAPPSVGTDSGWVWVNASTASRRHRSTVRVAVTGSGVAAAAGQVTASPASLSFGSLLPGQSRTLSTTLTNSGTAAVTVSQASVSSAAFAVTGLTLPANLAAGHSLTFNVVFTPTGPGAASAQLAVSSNASNSRLNIALAGSGTANGQLTLSPGTLNFGSVKTGSSAALTGTLAASGSPVTVSSVGSTSAEFVVSGIALPAIISAGQSMPFTVTFRPQAAGTATASLSFVSNAVSSAVTETLTGSGTGAVQHTVSLSWTPSATSGVVGYNLYRGTASGGPYIPLASRDVNPAYTDSTVSSGQTYYYVVTSVNASGTESVYSNQAQAVVPVP